MISSTMRSDVISARKSRVTVAAAPVFLSSERAARRKEVAVDLHFCLGLLKLLVLILHLIVYPYLSPLNDQNKKQLNNRKGTSSSP